MFSNNIKGNILYNFVELNDFDSYLNQPQGFAKTSILTLPIIIAIYIAYIALSFSYICINIYCANICER